MRKFALLAALMLAAGTQANAQAVLPAVSCTAPLRPAIEVNLYFGRDIATGGEVSDAQWAEFMAAEVTPRFPDGLSVVSVAGQSRNSKNQTLRERTKLLIVLVFDAPAHLPKVTAIVDAYNKRFDQTSVFRSEKPACAGA